jgi:hypothetical protein
MNSNDYEIIDVEAASEQKSQKIKELDSSIHSSENAKSEAFEESQKLPNYVPKFETSEKFEPSEKLEQSDTFEQSDNFEFSEDCKKSESISKSEKSSPIDKIFDRAFLSKEDEILTGKLEEMLRKEGKDLKEMKDNMDEELFLKIFKQHYFVAVFGMFSLYHIVMNLVSYFKDKA